MDEDWWFERGHNEYLGVQERLIDVFDGADTLTARLLLCTTIVGQLSTRLERPIDRVGTYVAGIAHALSGKEPAETKTLSLSFLDSEQCQRELDELEKVSDPEAFVDLQWALDRLETTDGYGVCAAVACATVAKMYEVTVDSLVAVVCELATRQQQYALTPEGAAGLIDMPACSESFSNTFDACAGLADAAKDHGPEGFLAFRNASPYLRTPSGRMARKYVAHADLEGPHGPVSAVVSATFNSVGKCNQTLVIFSGNEQNLVQLRSSVCDALAREFGPPPYATEKTVEWKVRYTDGELRYTVELTPEYTGAQLSLTTKIKPFW
jgi:hypothetical protein